MFTTLSVIFMVGDEIGYVKVETEKRVHHIYSGTFSKLQPVSLK